MYSWGIIAWQFVTGKASPYENAVLSNAGSVFGFFQSVQKGLRPQMDGIPPAMKELIHKCVHPDPPKRCTVESIGKHLQNAGLLKPAPTTTHEERRAPSKKISYRSLGDWIRVHRLDAQKEKLEEYLGDLSQLRSMSAEEIDEVVRECGMGRMFEKRFRKALKNVR